MIAAALPLTLAALATLVRCAQSASPTSTSSMLTPPPATLTYTPTTLTYIASDTLATYTAFVLATDADSAQSQSQTVLATDTAGGILTLTQPVRTPQVNSLSAVVPVFSSSSGGDVTVVISSGSSSTATTSATGRRSYNSHPTTTATATSTASPRTRPSLVSLLLLVATAAAALLTLPATASARSRTARLTNLSTDTDTPTQPSTKSQDTNPQQPHTQAQEHTHSQFRQALQPTDLSRPPFSPYSPYSPFSPFLSLYPFQPYPYPYPSNSPQPQHQQCKLVYLPRPGDSCASIAAAFGLSGGEEELVAMNPWMLEEGGEGEACVVVVAGEGERAVCVRV